MPIELLFWWMVNYLSLSPIKHACIYQHNKIIPMQPPTASRKYLYCSYFTNAIALLKGASTGLQIYYLGHIYVGHWKSYGFIRLKANTSDCQLCHMSPSLCMQIVTTCTNLEVKWHLLAPKSHLLHYWNIHLDEYGQCDRLVFVAAFDD